MRRWVAGDRTGRVGDFGSNDEPLISSISSLIGNIVHGVSKAQR